MRFNRRTLLRVLGALPFFHWVDPVRAIAASNAAVHYRLKRDGRSIYKLLRDHIRAGIHYSDLERILGAFTIFGPADHDYTKSAAPGYPDFLDVNLNEGDYLIEYPMSYMFLHLQLHNGYLVNHDPTDYEAYPDGFVLQDGKLVAIERPLDEGPLKCPPPTYNPDFDT